MYVTTHTHTHTHTQTHTLQHTIAVSYHSTRAERSSMATLSLDISSSSAHAASVGMQCVRVLFTCDHSASTHARWAGDGSWVYRDARAYSGKCKIYEQSKVD